MGVTFYIYGKYCNYSIIIPVNQYAVISLSDLTSLLRLQAWYMYLVCKSSALLIARYSPFETWANWSKSVKASQNTELPLFWKTCKCHGILQLRGRCRGIGLLSGNCLANVTETILSGKTVVLKEKHDRILYCMMSTYKNVSMACLKHESMICVWVSAAWVGVLQKFREMSWNFALPGEWSP